MELQSAKKPGLAPVFFRLENARLPCLPVYCTAARVRCSFLSFALLGWRDAERIFTKIVPTERMFVRRCGALGVIRWGIA